MHDALGDALVVEVGDLLAQDEVFEQRRPAQPGLERVLVVGDRHALVGRQRAGRPNRRARGRASRRWRSRRWRAACRSWREAWLSLSVLAPTSGEAGSKCSPSGGDTACSRPKSCALFGIEGPGRGQRLRLGGLARRRVGIRHRAGASRRARGAARRRLGTGSCSTRRRRVGISSKAWHEPHRQGWVGRSRSASDVPSGPRRARPRASAAPAHWRCGPRMCSRSMPPPARFEPRAAASAPAGPAPSIDVEQRSRSRACCCRRSRSSASSCC